MLETLNKLLLTEMTRLRHSFQQQPQFGIDSRAAIIELTRAFDYQQCRSVLFGEANDPESSELYCLGAAKAYHLFLDECVDRERVPLLRSIPQTQQWADSCIGYAGRLAQAERLVECCKAGIFVVNELSSTEIELRPAANVIDVEAFDVADQFWLRELSSSLDVPLRDFLTKRIETILPKMRSLTRSWNTHFISYDTDPEIDECFMQSGIAWGRTLDGQTELPGEGRIGGEPFYGYRAIVGALCGRALKHLIFANHLVKNHHNLDIRNLLTIWSTKHEWIEFACHILEIDSCQAARLLEMMILDREYLSKFSSIPGAPLPPLIQVGKDCFAMSLAGCLTRPFWFVLHKLKHLYRRDWDTLMDGREVDFRNDLHLLFQRPTVLRTIRNVKLRADGRDLTDIDAALFDSKHGTLGLFQLKWQDPFGHSMRERRSRMNNFVPVANKWVNQVSRWIDETNDTVKFETLGFNVAKGTLIKRIELFVIARHHARFTGADPMSQSACWGTWPQLCRILTEQYRGGNPLQFLADELRSDHLRTKSPRQIRTGEISIGDVRIRVIAAQE